MIEEKIIKLRDKLDRQINKNEKYEKIYETSSQIDKLIVEYYKKHGLTWAK
ncbi:MAG: Spo0E family sporulation regulatory protein-aspartic acid phosphatase [Clostridia bacterium]